MNPLLLLAQSKPSPMMEFVDKLARTPLSVLVMVIAGLSIIRFLFIKVLADTPKHKRSGIYNFFKFINETCDAFVYAGGLVFLVIRPFALQTFYVPSESMVSTLLINDFLIGNKWVYRMSEPKAGDIVIFRPPALALEDEPGADKYFIKRLMGVPGDVVEVKDHHMFRNGKEITEPYVTQGEMDFDFKLIKDDALPAGVRPINMIGGLANTMYAAKSRLEDQTNYSRQTELLDAAPVKIPDGYFLMIGDNRNKSFDGRFWGLVPRRDIIAKAEFIFLPFNRIRKLEHPNLAAQK